MSAAFVAEVAVRFGDVDSAGILYYPRFYHLLHVAFEDLCEHHLGVPYHRMIGELNLGFPSVRIETDFRRPFRFGDVLRVGFEVSKIGRSSVVFEHAVGVGEEPDPRARVRQTRVAVDMQTLRPVELPDVIRERLATLVRKR